MKEKTKETLGVCLGVAFVVSVVLIGWIIQATAEAAAFHRVTGKEVSTWDAMWLDLRVQEQTK